MWFNSSLAQLAGSSTTLKIFFQVMNVFQIYTIWNTDFQIGEQFIYTYVN